MEELLMSYIRNANPDATTSELDAKQIVRVKELTDSQRDALIQQYVDIVVDGMDHKDMYHFIYNTLTEDFCNLSDEELQCEIECTHDEELYTELVDNVTSQGG
tara:strand:- start:53 stop:361 length:309 start_codon:yes stop_codon:yes gene_type:complete